VFSTPNINRGGIQVPFNLLLYEGGWEGEVGWGGGTRENIGGSGTETQKAAPKRKVTF